MCFSTKFAHRLNTISRAVQCKDLCFYLWLIKCGLHEAQCLEYLVVTLGNDEVGLLSGSVGKRKIGINIDKDLIRYKKSTKIANGGD